MKTLSVLLAFIAVVGIACTNKEPDTDNKPAARFSITGYEMPTPSTINFINISTNATSYLWNFGNGNVSTQHSPATTYTLAGTYMVTLKVTGPGGVDSTCKLLTIESPPATNKSVFSYYQEKCAGTPVGISFKTVNPASTNPVWDFGNGSFSLDRDPVVQYLLPGDYTIRYSTQFGSIRDTVIRIIRIN